MTYDHVYHDLSCEQTEEVVREFLHDKNNGESEIKFNLTHPKEKELDFGVPSNEGNLEEELNGP